MKVLHDAQKGEGERSVINCIQEIEPRVCVYIFVILSRNNAVVSERQRHRGQFVYEYQLTKLRLSRTVTSRERDVTVLLRMWLCTFP